MTTNRLAHESSPYLRQHADNPVDWYPWGTEAFAEARVRDVPVLLSIGYSSCHWCHVMARESFADVGTAEVMNNDFVNVKVDREERPDVDAIYMEAVQALTGGGGWPLTVFLDPNGRPLYGGTYFPPEPRPGLPSFLDLLGAVSDAWLHRRDDLDHQAENLTQAIAQSQAATSEERALPADRSTLLALVDSIASRFDAEWGGFGSAPKFPPASILEFLLRTYSDDGDPQALSMVERTLDAMAAGGIYDHLGGGFSRYSTDRQWRIPHFEKMLYDQALAVRVYLHAWLVTGRDDYRQVVEETIEYVRRDLHHPEGGFFAAQDADSEGVEGKFYLWPAAEIDQVTGAGADAVRAWYGVSDTGNFAGANILHRPEFGALLRPPEIEDARRRLFEHRESRVPPGLDDKVLTEWNGLMIGSLAEAAAVFDRADWRDTAINAAEFLLAHLRRPDGRWMRSWVEPRDDQPPKARHLAYATDYAALVDGFTRLSEATGEHRWLAEARHLADELLERFWDHDRGGLFTTGHDAEELLIRPKELSDNPSPSAQSLAAHALIRLNALTGERRYYDHAEQILRRLSTIALSQPLSFGHLLCALDMAISGSVEVVITGDRPNLVRTVHRRFWPNVVLAWGERDESSPLWQGRRDGMAYVCQNFTCQAPVDDPVELLAELDTAEAGRQQVR